MNSVGWTFYIEILNSKIKHFVKFSLSFVYVKTNGKKCSKQTFKSLKTNLSVRQCPPLIFFRF